MNQTSLTTRSKQITSHLFMVRPAHFGFNEEAAESNAFMHQDRSHSAAEVRQLAVQEFDAFVERLRAARINVSVFEDLPEPHTPDAVFPNNWISIHSNGKMFLYPILAESRRRERRQDIIDYLQQFGPYQLIDLSNWELSNRFLESTGSMIMDREHQRVYACISPRTDPELMQYFCRETDCMPILFYAHDQNGQEIYHTNVMMALGVDFAVICLASISDPAEREMVVQSLTETGHEIIDITHEQVNAFAGNMLQVENLDGLRYLVMSQRAWDSLSAEQVARLEHFSNILIGPLDVIETYGGGSVRCMMAEIFS